MKKILIGLSLVMVVFAGMGWAAGIPHQIDFQGKLLKDGVPPAPAPGAHVISVFIDDVSSGAIIWPGPAVPPADLTVNIDDRGIFSLQIALPDNIPFDRAYELKIAKIDGVTIPALDMRQPFATVPYAFNSKNVIDTSGLNNGKIDLITTQGVAISGKSIVVNSTGVKGEAELFGVEGYSKGGAGVKGNSRDGNSIYGYKSSTDTTNEAIFGLHEGATSDNIAIHGKSLNGIGIVGEGKVAGVGGIYLTSPSYFGVLGFAPTADLKAGVYGQANSNVAGGLGVDFKVGALRFLTGASGSNNSSSIPGAILTGVSGSCTNGYGIFGLGPEIINMGGVVGTTNLTSPLPVCGNNFGVYGESKAGFGVYGTSGSGIGVYGSNMAAGNIDSPFKIKEFENDAVTYPPFPVPPGGNVSFLLSSKAVIYGMFGVYVKSGASIWYPILTMDMSYDYTSGILTVHNSSGVDSRNYRCVVVYR